MAENQSIEQILKRAIQFEEQAYDFYVGAVPMVKQPHIQQVLRDMAAEEVAYEDEFGMISMVATLHEIPPGVRSEAVQKAFRALRNNGFLIILDFPYPGRIEDFRNPRYNFGIIEQYFEAPQGVVHFSADQQDELLSEAGFKDIQRMDVGQGTFDFILARK